jgi:hypothetical protein
MQNKVLSVRRAKPNTLRPCRRVAASFNPLPQASAWAHYDQPDARQLYRRVFVPAAELLREGLPEPQV